MTRNTANHSMRWVDHIDEDMDIFFDRAVMIHYDGNILATGVLFRLIWVLTTFNPFRQLIKDPKKVKDIKIGILTKRKIVDWANVEYVVENMTISCARQIIPMTTKNTTWHGDNREHSPLHDLMVMRYAFDPDAAYFTRKMPKYSFDSYSKAGESQLDTGPRRTPIATKKDRLGRDIKFASIGFLSKPHIKKFKELRSYSFAADDHVQENCDRWLPRQWGIFICIRNVENFKALGSGAMLVSGNKLFGLGSFLLKRGKKSILVFTDLRQYDHLINLTCTIYDQNLMKKPEKDPESLNKTKL